MPYDLQSFTVALGPPVVVTLPSVTVSGQVTDSITGAVLWDFSSSLSLSAIVSQLTDQELQELIREFMFKLLQRRIVKAVPRVA